jgi:hypothetical protein
MDILDLKITTHNMDSSYVRPKAESHVQYNDLQWKVLLACTIKGDFGSSTNSNFKVCPL